jgi:23S rRNA (adenine2503-C2)-methyltransferase
MESVDMDVLEPLDERVSADGRTRKILFRLQDGRTIESALMLFRNSGSGRERRTVCVSSQVGCPVGCPFCATGQQGFERNLTADEIIAQALFFASRYSEVEADRRRWLTNVVFMGMGEPLANYDNVMQAVALLNAPKGLNFGRRQVMLSTVGLVPQIRRLAAEGLQFELAVSLHAASDELRDRLVPVNRQYPLEQLLPACREYAAATGRKIYIEYTLFEGLNDSPDNAEALLRLLGGLDCSINLITGNPTTSKDFQPSSRETALEFQKYLIAGGIRTMTRMPRGADIEAGCGQLRSRWLECGEKP